MSCVRDAASVIVALFWELTGSKVVILQLALNFQAWRKSGSHCCLPLQREHEQIPHSASFPALGFPGDSAGKADLHSTLGLGRSPGKGNSYPLQYSGLENSMDCTVPGVTKSQTWMSNFHFTSLHFPALKNPPPDNVFNTYTCMYNAHCICLLDSANI